MRIRRLTFETLPSREMLTGQVALEASSEVAESFVLDADADDDSVLISNESNAMARFTMRFNGAFSVNSQDLVEQIRAFEVEGKPDLPDYEKAYYYMLKYHAHDYAVTDKFYMHEPSLYVNSFGVGLCGDSAGALKLIWNEMGYESRLWYLDGHVVSEVHTGERWEMYDADLRVHYYNHDTGLVAGVEELAANPQFIYHPTVRYDNLNGTGVNHSWRTAGFYSSTENNWICERCVEHVEERDLVFQIPAGGSLQFGEITPDRGLPSRLTDTDGLSVMTVTIPKDSEGTLDIPLALYDVTGSSSDSVQVGSQVLRLGTGRAFAYANREVGGFETGGQRLDSISFSGNNDTIQIHYLVNKQITEILDENLVEIEHQGDPTELSVELVAGVEGSPNADVSPGTGDLPETEDADSSIAFDVLGSADFNGDGQADMARRSSDGTLLVSLSDGDSSGPYTAWGNLTTITEWQILLGDFDGDGLDDILGRAERDGTFWLAQSNGDQFFNSHWGRLSSRFEWTDLVSGDWNGDGREDTAARAADGTWWVSTSNGSRLVNSYWGRWSQNVQWSDVVVGDFNGDGLDDIAGRANNTYWYVSESQGEMSFLRYWGSWTSSATWEHVVAGDFNGDGRSDLAGAANNQWWVSLSNGSQLSHHYMGKVGEVSPADFYFPTQ